LPRCRRRPGPIPFTPPRAALAPGAAGRRVTVGVRPVARPADQAEVRPLPRGPAAPEGRGIAPRTWGSAPAPDGTAAVLQTSARRNIRVFRPPRGRGKVRAIFGAIFSEDPGRQPTTDTHQSSASCSSSVIRSQVCST